MRYITGAIATITIGLIVWIKWKPTIGPAVGRLMTRNQPETPADWKPRERTWKNGIEQ